MVRLLILIRKYWGKTRRQKLLLIEAVIRLVYARLLLNLMPTRYLLEYLKNRLHDGPLDDKNTLRICNEVAWAVKSAASRLPGKMVCFPQALAAQAMLQRCKIGTTLVYGIARSTDNDISAHVWLQKGDHGIIGHENSIEYNVLFRYPESSE